MRSYSKQKRDKTDHCNICGHISELTWDHVPPKACYNDFPVRYNRFMEGVPTFNNYSKSSQNGVKFRTICSDCNNHWLGAEYDPSFIKFVEDIVRGSDAIFTRTEEEEGTASIPQFHIDAQINRVTRSICGHFLAAKDSYDDKSTIDTEIRKFFFTADANRPENLSLLMWFYPYSTVNIVRDFLPANVLKKPREPLPNGVCSVLSSFPVAFILCEKGYQGTLIDLFSYCTSNINETATIPIDVSSCFSGHGKLRDPFWPCNVGDNDGDINIILATPTTTESSTLGIRETPLSRK